MPIHQTTINELIMISVIPLTRVHKNIAIRLSGGPDSAIIYYAICNFYKDDLTTNIFPMTMASPLRPHSIKKATDVINTVAKLTGRYPTQHYTVFHFAHNVNNEWPINSIEYTKSQEELESMVFNTKQIDARYAGLSINCPIDELTTMVNQFDNSIDYQKSLATRDQSRDVPTEAPVCKLDNITMYLPFAHHDKRTVFQVYKDYDVVESLYPVTWSCENDMQMQSDNPLHCGTCYFCLERIYAFGKI